MKWEVFILHPMLSCHNLATIPLYTRERCNCTKGKNKCLSWKKANSAFITPPFFISHWYILPYLHFVAHIKLKRTQHIKKTSQNLQIYPSVQKQRIHHLQECFCGLKQGGTRRNIKTLNHAYVFRHSPDCAWNLLYMVFRDNMTNWPD